MADTVLPHELSLSTGPTAPAQPGSALTGFAAPAPPSPPTPGVSSGVTRVPTGPTLPDEPTHLTLLVAQLATQLYGVDGRGLDAAPERGGAPESAAASPTAFGGAPATPSAHGAPAQPVELSPVNASTPEGAAHGIPAAPTAPAAPAAQDASSAHASAPSPFHGTPSFDALFAAPITTDAFDALPLVDFAPAAPSAPEAPAAVAPATSVLPTSALALEPHLGLDLGAPLAPTRPDGFDAYALREEFPILRERVHGKRLVWLDNAATTQKPKAVIDRLVHFYEHENSNIHRAAHALAARATDAYEAARESVRRFLNGRSVEEVVFVRGATEGINLVAQSWGRRFIESGDEIIVTHLEHHANIVPWQLLAKEKGARIRVAPVDDRGQILLDDYERLFNGKTKLVALPQVSNALGTVTPAKAMVDIAHRHGATVLVDGAQSVSHMRQDFQALDADFFVFSGHKVFAPTGIGAVLGKRSVWETTPPWQGGGNMIADVTFERTLFQPPPARFEAGTGNIADAVGLGAALDWLARVGIENVERHEHELLEYGTERLCALPGLTMIGTAPEKAGVLSFVIAGHNTHEVSSYLDKHGVAVRGGHHCAQPILRRFGQESTVRASLAPYNTREDLDVLVDALVELIQSGK
jgi:cysteine desulfurase/selenocysteine lyase